MPRALLSVYDKTGLEEFAANLARLGWDIIASGGTATFLAEAGISATPIEHVTGMSEMLGGRIKTLHPAIFAGILSREHSPADDIELEKCGYAPISMVVCTLFPFAENTRQSGIPFESAYENTDIGGQALLRAAAKNFQRVIVVCDPEDYDMIGAILRGQGEVSLSLHQKLAVKALAYTRDYDTAVHAFLSENLELQQPAPAELPQAVSLSLTRTYTLRYGENPHQKAAFYAAQSGQFPLDGRISGATPLSFNNLLDLDLAFRLAADFEQAAVALVKHQMPVGIATANTIAQAFPPALACDHQTASGSVLAVNRPIDDSAVAELGDLYLEALAAPDFTVSARETLERLRQNCSLIQIPSGCRQSPWHTRSIRGGFLLQMNDVDHPAGMSWHAVTKWKPLPEENETLRFAWRCARYTRTCAIVLAAGSATVGIGGGLPSQMDSLHLAIHKAGARARGAVMASDAALTSPDAIHAASEAGIIAIVQPGGALRDSRIIQAADEAGLSMIFTGVRHFSH